MAPPPPPPLLLVDSTAVLAWLFVEELSSMLRLARTSLKMAPPPRPPVARLFDRATALTIRLVPAPLRMPPPWSADPWVMVRPARVTVSLLLMSKTRLASLPLTAKRLAPGPSMSRFLLIASSPLVSVIVWPLRLGAKRMVSPLRALVIAARSDPWPLSRLFSTVRVLRTVRSSRPSSLGTNDSFRRAGRCCRLLRKKRNAMMGTSFWEEVCDTNGDIISRRADRAPGRWRAGAGLGWWSGPHRPLAGLIGSTPL